MFETFQTMCILASSDCVIKICPNIVERKEHVSDMATSIQAEKLEWKLISFLIPSYIYYHIAFSNIFSPLAEHLSC